MPKVKIEIAYDPSQETFAEAVQSLLKGPAYPEIKPADPEPKQLSFFDVPPVTCAATTTVPSPEAVPAAATTAEPIPDKTDIRAMATALAKKNKPALKAIFEAFGVSKLSDIPESNYAELMRKMVEANA